MNLDNEKEHCAASTSNRLTKSGIWRESLSTQYPDDSRNSRAAESLAALAKEAAALTDETWAELKPFYNWDCFRWREAVNLTARRVGFQHGRTTFPLFVRNLIGVLTPSKAA